MRRFLLGVIFLLVNAAALSCMAVLDPYRLPIITEGESDWSNHAILFPELPGEPAGFASMEEHEAHP